MYLSNVIEIAGFKGLGKNKLAHPARLFSHLQEMAKKSRNFEVLDILRDLYVMSKMDRKWKTRVG